MPDFLRAYNVANNPPDIDLANRVLKNCQFVTRGIALDGMILLPAGIDPSTWLKSPDILIRHARAESLEPPHVARGLNIRIDERFGVMDVQFAETQLARDWGMIYGLNDKKEVYARGWSVFAVTIESESWGLSKAIRELGEDYHPEQIPESVKSLRQIKVITKSLLTEVSLAPKRVDLDALTRCFTETGNVEAGSASASIRLLEAQGLVENLQTENVTLKQRVEALEREVKALSGEDASPAKPGYSEAILREARKLRELITNQQG